MALAQDVPPYIIFYDKTLVELAAARPTSRPKMAYLPRVGEAKLERYGPARQKDRVSSLLADGSVAYRG